MKIANLLAPPVIFAGLCLAQQPSPPSTSGGDPKSAAQPMTGCLSKGPGTNEFVLTVENGRKIQLVSTEDLSKHVAHKIRVTGAASQQQEKIVLRVEAVEHLADSCQ